MKSDRPDPGPREAFPPPGADAEFLLELRRWVDESGAEPGYCAAALVACRAHAETLDEALQAAKALVAMYPTREEFVASGGNLRCDDQRDAACPASGSTGPSRRRCR